MCKNTEKACFRKPWTKALKCIHGMSAYCHKLPQSQFIISNKHKGNLYVNVLAIKK